MTIAEIKKQIEEAGECWVQDISDPAGAAFRALSMYDNMVACSNNCSYDPRLLVPATHKLLTLKPEELQITDEVKLGETWATALRCGPVVFEVEAGGATKTFYLGELHFMYPNGLTVKRKIEVKPEPDADIATIARIVSGDLHIATFLKPPTIEDRVAALERAVEELKK